MPLVISILPTKAILNTTLVRFLCISDLYELRSSV